VVGFGGGDWLGFLYGAPTGLPRRRLDGI
jgi:hypothetical protein